MNSSGDFAFEFSSALLSLSKCHQELSSVLEPFRNLKAWNSQDKQSLLQTLAHQMFNSELALHVAEHFRPVIQEILQQSHDIVKETKEKHLYIEKHEIFSYHLSILLPKMSCIRTFILHYFMSTPSFFFRLNDKGNLTPDTETVLMIIRTAFHFLHHDFEAFNEAWNWSPLFLLINHSDAEIRWLALHVVSMVTGMSEIDKVTLIDKLFSSEEKNNLTLKFLETGSIIRPENIKDSNSNEVKVVDNSDDKTMDIDNNASSCFTKDDFTGQYTAICGVILPSLTNQSLHPYSSLVMVPSTQSNLHSLALAVASGSAVLLEGPVGSGKTVLVEYLAAVCGRTAPPELMKVQLGDQTDSKSLLGTYVCTDTPGEFVWQPGTLLQAVTHGQWVLLEDIDYAPMDVVSVLIPLLESRSLSVPGHGNVVKAAPGFQLFATQRTSSGGSSYHVHANSSILDRLWTRVNVEPLTKQELVQVLCNKYPDLESLAAKLVDVYSMVSSDDRLVSNTDTSFASLAHDKRLSTTRDLMKWTQRVAVALSHAPLLSDAKDVFLEALDCFCATLSKVELRLEQAMALGAKLGMTKEKIEFFCKNYKPKVHTSPLSLTVGRITLNRCQKSNTISSLPAPRFAHTRHSLILLERVAACISQQEPVLLVGETGTGKTSSIQNLAYQSGYRLKVINMSQQSDSADLLGGFKPVEMKQLVRPVKEEFENLFCCTFSRKQNVRFLSHVQRCFTEASWEIMFKLMAHSQKAAVERIAKGSCPVSGEDTSKQVMSKWQKLSQKIKQLRKQQKHAESALAFRFVEGMLVKAVRDGDWVLLDEINLATPETLECLSGLLESAAGSVVLLERGDVEPIVRHEDFRLFACMNPATDVGKKNLPPGIRNRFTEIFVDELEDVGDLKILVVDYLQGLSLSAAVVDGIVRFYLKVRHEANEKLTDGTGHKPHYSLRTLCRALRYASRNPHGNALRSIYEGFCLSFLTQLDRSSHPVVLSLIRNHILGHVNAASLLNQPLPKPQEGAKDFVKYEGFWVAVGDKEPVVPKHYVLTATVKENLRDLARVVSGRTFPVLLQGETSVGKTSLITWLAKTSGNQCVRINNHEHTDIQEYMGCYTSDQDGRLVFKEGVLVDAMRKGYWIILDELNLAPTDVLEALNRLLDDNRELFIPETQETVKAHPMFMLFATQNPPGQYGGRKVLSRAFRNRFVELHFDELPSRELEMILHERGSLPMSYAKKLVAVLLDLQKRRRSTSVFAGKQGFITLRDLFRWAERYSKNPDVQGGFYDWEQHLSEDGYMLLSGRCRNPDERKVIQEVLEQNFKRTINTDALFGNGSPTAKVPLSASSILDKVIGQDVAGFGHVVWTHNMKMLAVLVGRALQFGEPVLLVGETGCGKTTICQLFAALQQQKLYSVNCHMHSESSDFLGGLRPIRNRTREEEDGKLQKFFEWCDGPLVLAMKEGCMFLVDEISLADDSVLERLNSVLEPERTLVLAEKGTEGEGVSGRDVDIVVAHERFRVVSTMNPGGDFGKKELSPALRNRFTEIWCPSTDKREELIAIIEHNLKEGIQLKHGGSSGRSGFGEAMLDFIEWFHEADFGKRVVFSIRDLLSWVSFINTCCGSCHDIQPSKTTQDMMEIDGETVPQATHHKQPIRVDLPAASAYVHGACLVFLDSLGAGLSSFASSTMSPQEARQMCLDFLDGQFEDDSGATICGDSVDIVHGPDTFGMGPFTLARGPLPLPDNFAATYALNAPTTSQNALRIIRALQLPRPILLEGSPGVGKTSLVMAIAKASGHELVRINLSEQTDITDLFGADLPVEGGEPGQFTWRDGPLLRALKAGHWIVLDELNLASQSVLEGLNACLDHRAEVYIPELGMSFKVQHEKTRMFACQNPLNQGGGRKGLPKSFLNRFTQVYVKPLSMEDLLFVAQSMYPRLDKQVLHNMVAFNMQLHQETVVEAAWGKKGSPWEFNLRDVFRWCDLVLKHQAPGRWNPSQFVKLIYSDRMRTSDDKAKVLTLFQDVFGIKKGQQISGNDHPKPFLYITPSNLQVGHSFLPRSPCFTQSRSRPLELLHHHLPYMESLMKCLEMNWMAVLIGPRSCGKTSLVQMVSELTGNKLDVMSMNSAMDTTELLGGFEQADLNRHWEETVSKAKHVVLSTVRTVLVKKVQDGAFLETANSTSEEVIQLYKTWKSFVKLNSKASKEESQAGHGSGGLTKQKLQILLKIMETVLEMSTVHGFDLVGAAEVNTAILELKARYEGNKCSTHCGGQFEWVDGQLVEALKSGNWLLIDNVNFCSPSVLDRLNALLEPGGVLSINERGVIDGEVPAVKPHPDFRLILTMDPRYGEISRAMRNRGVEVYMQGEDEEDGYDTHDLHCMLSGAGLLDVSARQTLLSFHDAYKKKLGGSILDLLHTASMITDLLERGSDMRSAVTMAVSQVYVKSHVNDREREIAKDLVIQMIDTCQPNTEDELVLPLHPGPSVSEFSTNTTLSTLRWHCTPIVELLCQQTSINQLGHALSLVLERASLQDWQLRRDILLHVLGQEEGMLLAEDKKDQILRLSSVVLTTLENVFGSTLMKKLRTLLEQLSQHGSCNGLIANQPYDIRLNTNVSQRLAMHCGYGVLDGTQYLQMFSALANRLHLLGSREKFRVIQGDRFEKRKTGKRSARTLMKYSQDFHMGLLTSEALPHSTIAHLYPFFELLDAYIEEKILLVHPLTDSELTQVQEALLWRDRLWRVCASPPSPPSAPFKLSSLSLHWQWFMEKTMHVVPQLLDQATERDVPSDLVTVVKQLSAHLGSDNRLAKLHLRILSEYGHPMPFQLQHVYENWEKLRRLAQSLEIDPMGLEMNEYQRRKESAKLNLMMAEGSSLRGQLVQAMVKVLSAVHGVDQRDVDTPADVDTMAKTFNTSLSTHGLVLSESGILSLQTTQTPSVAMDSTEENEEDQCGIVMSPENTVKSALYPLFFSLSSFQEMRVMAQLLTNLVDAKCKRSQDTGLMDELSSVLKVFHDYAICNTTRSPGILACYNLISTMMKNASDASNVISSVESAVILSVMMQKPCHNMTKLLASSADDRDNLHMQVKTAANDNVDACAFDLLTNLNLDELTSKKKREESENDPLSSVTIGNYKEKHQQLVTVGQHFWCNSDLIDNQQEHLRSSSLKLLTSKFVQVVRSLALIADDERVQETALSLTKAILSLDQLKSLEPADQLIDDLKVVAAKVRDLYVENSGDKDAAAMIQVLLVELFCQLRDCLNKGGSTDNTDSSLLNGYMWTNLGLLQTLILSPVGPVDPMEQVVIELQYVREEIADIKDEVFVRLHADQIWTGSRISLEDVERHLADTDCEISGHFTSNPDRMSYLMNRWKQLRQEEASLAQKTALRPPVSQHEAILSAVNHYTATVGNPDNVRQLLQQIKSLAACLVSPNVTLNKNEVMNLLNQLHTWRVSQVQFISHMERDFTLYHDVIMPFLSAAAQVVHGMTLARRSLQTLLQRHVFILKCPTRDPLQIWLPEKLIQVFCGYRPIIECSLLTAKNTSLEFAMDCIQGVVEMTEMEKGSKGSLQSYLGSRLLWWSLLSIRNKAVHYGYLSSNLINAVISIYNDYLHRWTLAKEEEQRKEQEEGSLYKYKTISHGTELDESQQVEVSLCKAFPSYDDDFSDLNPSNSLEEVMPKPGDQEDTSLPQSEAQQFMDIDNVRSITRIHELLFTSLPTERRLVFSDGNPVGDIQRNTETYHEEVLQTGYQATAVLSDICSRVEGLGTGDTNWQAHLLQCNVMRQRLFTSEDAREKVMASKETLHGKRHYDIYHDANISEVVRARAVMDDFTSRINELLTEWPGNPILTQLQLFVDRILSLPVTSPVMKVLTGVELLLKNAQEWEANASRHVSIKDNLDALTQLIINWRKLELRCWSSLLDVATDKVADKASQWWFYVYGLLQQIENDMVDGGGQESPATLIDPLQKLIESSSLGEFSARMRILYSFYNQYLSIEGNIKGERNTNKISSVILNIYMYYDQFSPAVTQNIQQAREPIEKELRDYVKIAKWNDANFWAMKQAAEKSHRTLHKFVSRYENALGEPIRKLLMDTKTILGSLEKEEASTAQPATTFNTQWFILTEDTKGPDHGAQSVFPGDLSTAFSHIPMPSVADQLEKLPKLCTRMKRLCRKMLTQQQYPDLLSGIDEFTGEIIESVQELQALSVDAHPKEKRSQARKHIHLRKRKALAELFKTLQLIGLSYRKGLNAAHQSSAEDSPLMLPALDDSVVISHCDETKSGLKQALSQMFSGCQHYYHRCLARSASLTVTMTTPSKELTVGDIDRCKGFTHHLLRVVQNQRRDIASMTDNLMCLRLAIKSLTGITVGDDSQVHGIPSQKELKLRMVELMDVLTWTSDALQHSSVVMKCCPDLEFSQERSPLPSNLISEAAKASTNSRLITNIRETIQECMGKVTSLADLVRPRAAALASHVTGSDVKISYILASWSDFQLLSEAFKNLQEVKDNVETLLPYFSSSFPVGSGLGSTFHGVNHQLQKICSRFDEWNSEVQARIPSNDAGAESLRLLAPIVDRTVTAILLGVQRIAKAAEESDYKSTRTEEINEDKDEEQCELLSGHLTSRIHGNLMSELTKLDLPSVTSSVATLITSLRDFTDSSTDAALPSGEQACTSFSEQREVIDESTATQPGTSVEGEQCPGSLGKVGSALVLSSVSLLRQYVAFAESYFMNLLSSHRTCCKLLSVLLAVFTELAAKGFCLPPEVEDEEGGEGATEFEDIEGGGMGEGEGAKDVSDQIESEDQLQDAKQEGQKEEKQDNAEQQQVPDEENGIEMSEDFDGALHDAETEEREDDSGDDGDDDEPDLDKQMGELDGQENETLDEKIWGDSDDEDEKEDKDAAEEEKGAGAEAESESKMVAKEDNKDAVDESKEKEDDTTVPEDQDNVHELPKDDDQGNLSDEEQAEPQGEGEDASAPPGTEEDMELPDDLQLDDQEGQEDQGEDEEGGVDREDEEEAGMDIDDPDVTSQEDRREDASEEEEEEQDKADEDDEDDGGKGQELGEDEEVDEEENDGRGNEDWKTNQENEDPDAVQAVEDLGTNDGSENENQAVEKAAGQSTEPAENKDQQGVGTAGAAGSEGHVGEADTAHAQSTAEKSRQRKEMNRSRSERSLGSTDERTQKRLKTVDEADTDPAQPSDAQKASDLYQHMREEEKSGHDAQTFDSATADQAKEQDGAIFPDQTGDGEDEEEEFEDYNKLLKEKEEQEKIETHQKSLPVAADSDMKAGEEEDTRMEEVDADDDDEKDDKESSTERLLSTYHVSDNVLSLEKQNLTIDADRLRSHLEQQLSAWSHLEAGSRDEQRNAQEAWQKYELLTASLAQELCEQLRLVLEPSLATKLKGDYRTGKRLNMRKVIPYIASQFRKDKIWLRRTKPSKRQYQIMLAVDDSSSMADNHSKQLAFESLAVISKAMTRLEAGDLGVCSFGESVKLLHPLHEPFSDQSGAKILQQFTFDQKKTKIAQLVDTCTSLMLSSRSRMQSSPRSDTSQLLLIVSDGRGVFLEGMETVLRTVRTAKEAGIFLVFVILDNPVNRDSVLDIKVPIFRPGKLPEIKSYMEQFPFPFYIILRNINALPVTLSDALRQWFELVTSMDS